MFPDLLLNTDNLVPEVRFAPLDVTSHLQIELVEVGEARERNNTADITQGWNPAENRNEAPPYVVPQIVRLIWSRAVSSLAVHAEEHNDDGKKWLDTVPDSNPSSHSIVSRIQDSGFSAVILVKV